MKRKPYPQRPLLHVVATRAMLQRIDSLIGELCLNRSEAARMLIIAGLDALEARRAQTAGQDHAAQ